MISKEITAGGFLLELEMSPGLPGTWFNPPEDPEIDDLHVLDVDDTETAAKFLDYKLPSDWEWSLELDKALIETARSERAYQSLMEAAYEKLGDE